MTQFRILSHLPQPTFVRPNAIGTYHYYTAMNPSLAKNIRDWAIENQVELWEEKVLPIR